MSLEKATNTGATGVGSDPLSLPRLALELSYQLRGTCTCLLGGKATSFMPHIWFAQSAPSNTKTGRMRWKSKRQMRLKKPRR